MKVYQILDERELIENEIDLRYHAILLSLHTGMRFGEIVGLTKDSFDFDNNKIKINKTWGYTNKMQKGFGDTKNKENRKIKVGKTVMDIFKKTIEWTIPNDHKLFFYVPKTKYSVISNSGTNDLLKEITSKIDIGDVNFHGLRHTHASILLYHKVSIQYVSERLGHNGHNDITTTYQFYSHVIKELRKEDEDKTIKIFD